MFCISPLAYCFIPGTPRRAGCVLRTGFEARPFSFKVRGGATHHWAQPWAGFWLRQNPRVTARVTYKGRSSFRSKGGASPKLQGESAAGTEQRRPSPTRLGVGFTELSCRRRGPALYHYIKSLFSISFLKHHETQPCTSCAPAGCRVSGRDADGLWFKGIHSAGLFERFRLPQRAWGCPA